MFNAPEIIKNISEIVTIYNHNDVQEEELNNFINEMDDNISLDDMKESGIKKWEKILKVNHFDDDTLEERRFRVKAKRLEKLPYSYRVIRRKLNILCGDNYTFDIDDKRSSVSVKIGLKSKRMKTDVISFLDDVLPLNMIFSVSILYNQHYKFKSLKYGEMKKYKHNDLREKVFE